MSQSNEIQKQIDDLAEIALQLDDNKELQDQLDRRIEVLGRTMLSIKAMEEREATQAVQLAKLEDANDEVAKRIEAATEDIGKDADEKTNIKNTLKQISVNDTKALDTFAYLKDKKMTTQQIKLVLGL